MKLLYKFGVLCLGLLAFACSESLEELNIDPDRSPSARPQEVLTSAQGYMSWVLESQYNERAFLWGQYWTWGPGVAIGDDERYIMSGSSANNAWTRTYANALTDLQFLTRSEVPVFVGVGKILQAYTYQGLVDHFGDVPFSEAILGEIEDGSIIAPKYDDAATIYAALIPMIDEGLAELAKASSGDLGSEDLIYGGDISKWRKFAKSLKLRILMRQSVTGNQGEISSAVKALINEGDLISSEADAPFMDFIGQAGDENPMFADMESGIGNFYIASNSSLNVLESLADPRLPLLYAEAVNHEGEIIGIDQGSIDNEPFTSSKDDYSQGTKITYASDNPAIFMSHWEVWFLRAEAAMRFGTADDAETALLNAITKHFEYLGLTSDDAEAYMASLDYDAGASMNEQIKILAIQKWISMNGLQEAEGWLESLRFDTPDNPIFTSMETGIYKTPLESVLNEGVHPSSWVYPATEQSLNKNAPAQKDIRDKVFWDN